MTPITRRAGLTLSLGGAAALFGDHAHAALLDDLIERARKEGAVNSLGMPDDWANWEATWKAITAQYGIKHTDTDMSSAEELAKFAAERANAWSTQTAPGRSTRKLSTCWPRMPARTG